MDFHCSLSLIEGDSHRFPSNPSPKLVHSSNISSDVPTSTTSLPAPPSPQPNSRSSPIPTSAPNPFQSQTQSEPPSPPKEMPIAVENLLDIMGDEPTAPPTTSAAPLINTTKDLFDLDLHDEPMKTSTSIKHDDLLGVDFTSMSLDQPIIHRNASETVFPPSMPINTPTTPTMTATLLKPENKSSSTQNIDRSDPFKDLFSSSSSISKGSSKETLGAQHAAATAAKMTNPPPKPSMSSMPTYNPNLNSKPTPPPTSAPTPPPPPAQAQPKNNSRPAGPSTIDFSELLQAQAGTDKFGSVSRQNNMTIGEKRKAEVEKDLDPSVIKVI